MGNSLLTHLVREAAADASIRAADRNDHQVHGPQPTSPPGGPNRQTYEKPAAEMAEVAKAAGGCRPA